MRTWNLPQPMPGEDNWEWCKRAAATIPADELMCLVVRYLDRREKRRGSPTWSVIGEITGHGSGVSTAIVERFRREKVGDE